MYNLYEMMGASYGQECPSYEFRVKLMLADDLAKTIADLWASAVPVAIHVFRGELFDSIRDRTNFLDRADPNTVGFSQGAIDRPRFSNTHLGTLH